MFVLFNLIGIFISLYFVFDTEFLTHHGYGLSVDGIVVARALFIIFALHCGNNIGRYYDIRFKEYNKKD